MAQAVEGRPMAQAVDDSTEPCVIDAETGARDRLGPRMVDETTVPRPNEDPAGLEATKTQDPVKPSTTACAKADGPGTEAGPRGEIGRSSDHRPGRRAVHDS
jgi:hypothetical protein